MKEMRIKKKVRIDSEVKTMIRIQTLAKMRINQMIIISAMEDIRKAMMLILTGSMKMPIKTLIMLEKDLLTVIVHLIKRVLQAIIMFIRVERSLIIMVPMLLLKRQNTLIKLKTWIIFQIWVKIKTSRFRMLIIRKIISNLLISLILILTQHHNNRKVMLMDSISILLPVIKISINKTINQRVLILMLFLARSK